MRRSNTSVKVRAASPAADDSPPRPSGFFGACLPRRRQGTPLLPTLTFEEIGIEEISGEADDDQPRGDGGGGGGGGGAEVHALSPVVEDRAKR